MEKVMIINPLPNATSTDYSNSDCTSTTDTYASSQSSGPTAIFYIWAYEDSVSNFREPWSDETALPQITDAHRFNWWDWFRTGFRFQESRKKWTRKISMKYFRVFWRRNLPHKSGWVGKAMARKKGMI
jgi:hypothetical protein